MKLTNTAVRNARPKAKPYKLADGGGLYLLVQPNGRKLWRMNYRYLTKQKTLAFGAWPEIELEDARDRRDKAERTCASDRRVGQYLQNDRRRVGQEAGARGLGRNHAGQDQVAARQSLRHNRQSPDRQNQRAGGLDRVAEGRGIRPFRECAAH